MARNVLKGMALLLVVITLLAACSNDSELDVREQGNGIVFGRIVDENTNNPIQGSSVTIYPGGRTMVTGNNGQYEFVGLSNGCYIVQISKKGYLSQVETVSIDPSNISIQSDVTLCEGDACLSVMLGELDFGDNHSSKTFVVSNKGNKTITWNLYSDYHSFLSFDITEGMLAPNECVAVNVNILRMGTSAELNSFPIYIYAEGEELGAIATVNRTKDGTFNSLLIGTWSLEEKEFWQYDANDYTYNVYNSANAVYITFNEDFSYTSYERQFINNGIENVDNMFSYKYNEKQFSYDQANNMIQIGEYGQIYKINNLTNEYLELETPQFREQEGGERLLFKRWKK